MKMISLVFNKGLLQFSLSSLLQAQNQLSKIQHPSHLFTSNQHDLQQVVFFLSLSKGNLQRVCSRIHQWQAAMNLISIVVHQGLLQFSLRSLPQAQKQRSRIQQNQAHGSDKTHSLANCNTLLTMLTKQEQYQSLEQETPPHPIQLPAISMLL